MIKIFKQLLCLCIILSISISVSATSINTNKKTNMSNNISQKWALIIGVPTALHSQKDATDMKNVLVKNGWLNSHITILTLLETTKLGIIANLNILSLKEDADDTVVFYFSGHGNRGVLGTLILAENTEITVEELKDIFDRFDSKKQVLIFDCCMSGSMSKSTTDICQADEFENVLSNLAKPGRIIIASCGRFESAYSDSVLENGIFTYNFVNGLDNKGFADKNLDGFISAEEAFSYAKPKTTLRMPLQHPKIYDGISGQVAITQANNANNLFIKILQKFSTFLYQSS